MHIEQHVGPRELLRPLFELAEDSPTQLDGYLDAGWVLVALEDGQAVGHLQLTDTAQANEIEIRNMAVLPSHQRRGVGRALVMEALALARAKSRVTVVVATAAAGTGNLRFYQRLGFRMRSIERDAFTEVTGYPAGVLIDGIELRDRVWLDLALV